MGLTLTPIATGGRSRTALEDVDADTALAVEEAYEWCQANPAGRLETPPFADRDAAESFLHEARSYAYQRPAARVVVSGNSTGKFVVRFRVDPYVAPVSETPASA